MKNKSQQVRILLPKFSCFWSNKQDKGKYKDNKKEKLQIKEIFIEHNYNIYKDMLIN